MRRKIKILQFPIANSYGGITHYALNNWKYLDKNKFQCDFATMSAKLDFAEELEATGSKIHYISCYAEDNEKRFIKEINEILDKGYDIVHLHTKQWKSFLFEQICMERKVPRVIVHAHSTKCDAKEPEIRELETRNHFCVRKRLSENIATDFWACSDEAADWLYGDRIPREKICVMKNAIEVEKFAFHQQTRDKLRREYGLENKFVMGNVGRLVYQKNQSFLIEAFARAYEKRQDLELILLGDGELRQNLEKQAAESGIAQAVHFLGKRENVNAFYQMMDLFVLPSNFEGLPIALIEAQTAGLKCICSDYVSKDADLTGNTDFLPLDVNRWANEILEKCKSYERKNMAETVIHAGYDIKAQIKEIERMYIENTSLFENVERGGVILYRVTAPFVWTGRCA